MTIDYDSIALDYKKIVQKSEKQEVEIKKLKKEVEKYKKLAEDVSYLRVENRNLTKANIRLADIIKVYNPHYFGQLEGRHDNELPYEDEL